MLRIVTFKWAPAPGYHTRFDAQHVNVMARMVKRFYSGPHEFICITDDPEGLSPSIRSIPLWPDFSDLPNPNGPSFPSCYRRLKLFSPDAADLIGERFVMIDLDCVITGDLHPLWHRAEDFVILRSAHPQLLYSGAMVLMRAGARSRVWSEFDPAESPLEARRAGHFGSDQAWISTCLGPGEACWTPEDGVYSFYKHILPNDGALPSDARLVNFHGAANPWDAAVRAKCAWVSEYWN
jgi:hypothetical protein